MRRAAPLLFLAACGGPSKQPTAPPDDEAPPVTATCADVARHLAELTPATDRADPAYAEQNCVEQQWSPDVIGCVAAAPTLDAAFACFAVETALCAPLREMIEAGVDREFTALRVGEDPDDAGHYPSAVVLPGARECHVDEAGVALFATCTFSIGIDPAAGKSAAEDLAEAVQGCLPSWTVESYATTLEFVDPEEVRPSVAVTMSTPVEGKVDVELLVIHYD